MNILVIPMTDWVHHPVPSGMNHYCDVLAERHNVHVLQFNFDQFKDQPALPTKCKLMKYPEWHTNSLISYYTVNALNHKRAIAEAVEHMDIDVILSSNILPSMFAYGHDVPVVFDYRDVLHEAAAVYYSSRVMKLAVASVTNPMISYNLQRADHIVSITPELCDYIASKYSLNREQMTDIPCGVDTSLFKPIDKTEAKKQLMIHPSRKIVGYVGSIEPWIDLKPVIDAMHSLDALLFIIGPGLHTNYVKELQEYCKAQFGDNSPVEWLGRRNYADLPLFISAMDVGVNPLQPTVHNQYSFGSKIMNYLACGTPVVSTPMQSIIQKKYESGHTHPEKYLPIKFYHNYSTLINAIEVAIKTKWSFPWETIAQYDWKQLAARYETVLESVLRR